MKTIGCSWIALAIGILGHILCIVCVQYFVLYSDCEENKDKQIEVGWTMYKNIIVSYRTTKIPLL